MKRQGVMSSKGLSRRVLLRGLFGTGYVGLGALASGLPQNITAWLAGLTGVPSAHAETANAATPAADAACSDRAAAQYVIFSASVDGDPVNTNAPGTYDVPGIVHPQDPQMAPVRFSLAGQTVTAARPWSTLPQKILDHTCFFHLTTRTNAHPHLAKVLRLGGAPSSEMLPSLIARYTAGCLGTAQKEPLVLGPAPVGNKQTSVISYDGRSLPNLTPTTLRDLLTASNGPLANLATVRDQTVDKLHALLRERGQRTLGGDIEDRALSKRAAKALGDQLRADLAAIHDDGPDAQVVAAVALLRMNTSPVVALRVPFGGDNHFDYGLLRETSGTVAGVAQIALLMQKLTQYGLVDRTTFAMLNTFGRTLKKRGYAGREHWAHHHTGVLIGRPFRGGVIGGLAPGEGDFCALPIDSQTGRGDPSGDIAAADTLVAFGRTLARGVGMPDDVATQVLPPGRWVRAALQRP